MSILGLSFFLYTAGILAVGIYSMRFGRKTSSDFLLADRGLGAWVAALSSSASAESGWVTLGLVGMAFKTGIGTLWIIPGTLAAFIFNWVVVAPRLRRASREHEGLTLPDILSQPYPGTPGIIIRSLAVLIILSMLTAYIAAQLNAAGKTFTGTFDWSYPTGVLLGAGIIIGYTVTGGFRAVAWTDVVQAIFMVTAVVILPMVLIMHVGGRYEVLEHLKGYDPILTDGLAGNTGMALIGFFAVWLGIPLGYPGQPHILVRLMAVKNETARRRAAIISTAWVCLLFTGAVLLGIVARAAYGTLADPEKALLIAAADFLPGGLAGLIIAAVLAAICSTADSQLLLTASSVSHDIAVELLKLRTTARIRLVADRLAVLFVGLVATGIALGEIRVVFDFVLYAWAGLGAGFGPVLVLRLLWKRTTGWGVVAGMVVGVTTAVVWRVTLHDQLYELVPAFLFSFVAAVIVSLLTSPAPPPGRARDHIL
jgi:sodium/proline symporter